MDISSKGTPPPLKMTIIRTNPEQDKPVRAYFFRESEHVDPLASGDQKASLGLLEVPYGLWMQLEKLLKDGMERRQREGNTRLTITFRPIEEKPLESDPDEVASALKSIQQVEGVTVEGAPDRTRTMVD